MLPAISNLSRFVAIAMLSLIVLPGTVSGAKMVSRAGPLDNGRPGVEVKSPVKAPCGWLFMSLQIVTDLAYDAKRGWQCTLFAPFEEKRVNVTFTLAGPNTLRAKILTNLYRGTATGPGRHPSRKARDR